MSNTQVCNLVYNRLNEIVFAGKAVECEKVILDVVQLIKSKIEDKEDVVSSILDFAIRKVAHDQVLELSENDNIDQIGYLLDICICGVQEEVVLNSLPYRVLEDFMEGQTITKCQEIWNLLENRKEVLTGDAFIPKAGKTLTNSRASLCLLKLSNSLLRRLSKSNNTEFCGRILVFLAYTFPLGERSAVNLAGKSNVGNVTEFEEEGDFDIAQALDAAMASKNKEEHATVQKDKEHSMPVDYKLYKTFWNLQRFYRNANAAIQSGAHWEMFLKELNIVLCAFEGNSFSKIDLERAKERRCTKGLKTNQIDHYFQPKYLTNSRLLRLQLRDPLIREAMLTQFLILFKHLMGCKLPGDASTPKSKLAEMETRVLQLMMKTPPDGPSYASIVINVLEREGNWVKWKQNKCPVYEKYPDEMVSTWFENTSKAPVKPRKKRPATLEQNKVLSKVLSPHDPKQTMQLLSSESRNKRTKFETLIEAYTEAWDPENAIEEEYWPDKDKLHAWRTMRATSKYSISLMEHATQGSGAIVSKYTGKHPPVKAPTMTVDEPMDVEPTKEEPMEVTDNTPDN